MARTGWGQGWHRGPGDRHGGPLSKELAAQNQLLRELLSLSPRHGNKESSMWCYSMPLHLHQLQVQMLWELVSLLFYLLHQARKRNEIVWHQLHAQEQAQSHGGNYHFKVAMGTVIAVEESDIKCVQPPQDLTKPRFSCFQSFTKSRGRLSKLLSIASVLLTFVHWHRCDLCKDQHFRSGSWSSSFFFLCSAHTVFLPRVHSWGGLIKRRSVKISHGQR